MDSPPLRIALATNRFRPSFGGVQIHVERLAEHLTNAGHQITVLTHQLDDDPLTESGAYEVRRFPTTVAAEHYNVSRSLGTYIAQNRHRWDLLHMHGYHDSVPLIAMRSWDGPMVFTPHFHGASASRLRNLLHQPYKLIARRIVARSDSIICVTEAERRQLTGSFPSAAARSFVISNGVDLDRLDASAAPLEPDGRRLLLACGRLEAYKNVDRIICAMPALRDDFVLRIAGEGPHRSALERFVDQHGLHDTVAFEGRVSDERLGSLLRRADAFVSLSEHEAQGIALLEALAFGTPVVGSDIPAHRDVAQFATTADPAQRVRLVDIDAPLSAIGAAIRCTATERGPGVRVPTWQDIAAATARVYKKAVQQHRSAELVA